MNADELYKDLQKKAADGPASDFNAAYEAWAAARNEETKEKRDAVLSVYQNRQRTEAEIKGKARQAERDRIEEEARKREEAAK